MKIAALSLLLLSGTCLADASVSLYYQGKQLPDLALADGARLDTLLRNSQLPPDIYWRSAQITTPERQYLAEQQQILLLNELADLEAAWRTDGEYQQADSARHLAQQLSKLTVTGRLPVVLDPDQALRAQADNPRLDGAYRLYIAPRQPQVAMFGLIAALPALPLVAGEGIDAYWRRDALLAGADSAHVLLIQPTGDIEQVPVAVWNKRHREPLAGAAMLVGFDADLLPAAFQGINQRIAEIIANRVPK
ncbi:capsule biosynthesis GfcC D2 domain-containing protein [Aeromonas enteropelogenes]|uniref:capsule biosynthesis GfcC D2 domain-containing protein n=1 Tax=Aeromonas enteropelogenes TaxID=29489 RepID=UPI003BA2AF57